LALPFSEFHRRSSHACGFGTESGVRSITERRLVRLPLGLFQVSLAKKYTLPPKRSVVLSIGGALPDFARRSSHSKSTTRVR